MASPAMPPPVAPRGMTGAPPPPGVDYEALAKQAGAISSRAPGDIDYEALARQASQEPKSLKGFGKNVLSSAGKFAGDVVSAATNPVGTAKGLLDVGMGTVAKMSGTEKYAPDQVAKAEAVGDAYKKKYGSGQAIADTLYNDPVGAAADASTVLGGAGALAKGASIVSKAAGATRAAGALSDVGNIADTASAVTNPANLSKAITAPVKMAAKAVGNKVAELPERLMRSAIRPGSVTDEARDTVAATALSERANPADPNIRNVIKQRIKDLTQQVNDKAAAGTQVGMTVDPQSVASRIDPLIARAKNSGIGDADVATLQGKKAEFLSNNTPQQAPQPPPSGLLGPNGQPLPPPPPPPAPKPTPIPLDQALQKKRDMYDIIGDPAFKRANNPPTIEGSQALARGMRQEIGSLVPEILQLDERNGNLIKLNAELERFAKQYGNRQMAPHNPTQALKAFLDDPGTKAKLAITLNDALTSPTLKRAVDVGKVAKDVLPSATGSMRTGSRVFPMQQLPAFAQANGISPDEAKSRLDQEGWQVH